MKYAYTPIPWYGSDCRLGLHVDFHASANDVELGAVDVDALESQLRCMNLDFVQIDSKGGGGFTSYYAKTPGATVCPVLKGDLVKAWRLATRRVRLPLHAHWIAISDGLANQQHPDWRRVDEKGVTDSERLCYRSPFVDACMIPQLLELIGDWQLDGLWVDGEAWNMLPCWCPNCLVAWKAEAGETPAPSTPTDAAWSRWMMFHRRGFDAYINRYADAIHARFPNCRICDNWSLTLSQPGAPSLHVDFISSDDAAPYGVENIRHEARFVATRGLPWDFMQWLFYGNRVMHDPTQPQSVRPLEQIQQEAAYVLALGGNHQIYENPSPRRDGGLIDWRVDRISAVNRWCRQRVDLCRDAEPWEDVAVLNSEHHHERHATGANLLWSFDMNALRGAVSACLARHRGVDIVDEWALLPRLDRFAVLIVPEQEDVSDNLVSAVKAWVHNGGRLLLSGAGVPERWGADFLGVESGEVAMAATYHVPANDGRVPIWSKTWRLATLADARDLGVLSGSDDLVRDRTAYPAAMIRTAGKGAVAWVPCDAFAFFERSRYALLREFLGGVLDELGGRRDLRIRASLAVEPILRRRADVRVIHLINRAGGFGTGPNDSAVEQIPPVGPIEIELALSACPDAVHAAWEGGALTWSWTPAATGGTALIRLDRLQIHEAIVVKA